MKIRSKISAKPQVAHRLRKKKYSRDACRKSKGRRERWSQEGGSIK